MTWYYLALWLAGIGLESVLVARAWVWRGFERFPLFSFYIVWILIQDIFFLIIYRSLYPFPYASIYWYTEFLSIAAGCAVCWEIFRFVLRPYPGASRMARSLLLISIIGGIFKAVLATPLELSSWGIIALAFERNLRGVQALGLVVLALLCMYYRIPMSRNTKGIFLGYGMVVASYLITLTSFRYSWNLLHPLSYLVVLIIWCTSLWRYEPEPLPRGNLALELDYQSLVLATRKGLLQARTALDRSTPP